MTNKTISVIYSLLLIMGTGLVLLSGCGTDASGESTEGRPHETLVTLHDGRVIVCIQIGEYNRAALSCEWDEK